MRNRMSQKKASLAPFQWGLEGGTEGAETRSLLLEKSQPRTPYPEDAFQHVPAAEYFRVASVNRRPRELLAKNRNTHPPSGTGHYFLILDKVSCQR